MTFRARTIPSEPLHMEWRAAFVLIFFEVMFALAILELAL